MVRFLAVALLVFGAACNKGSRIPGGASAAPRHVEGTEPLGLCPEVPSDSSNEVRFEVARLANERGCPKVALATLEPVDARYRAGLLDDATVARMVAISAESRRQILAEGQNRHAPPGTFDLYELQSWMWAGSLGPRESIGARALVELGGDRPSAVEAVERLLGDALLVAKAARSGLLAAADGDVSDAFELALRSVMVVPCTTSVAEGRTATRQAVLEGGRKAVHEAMVGQVGQPSGDAMPLWIAAVARAAAWSCERQVAAEGFHQALALLMASGREDAAARVAIDFLELEVFPNGRADDLLTGDLSLLDYEIWAGHEEAAALGEGPWHADADRFESEAAALVEVVDLSGLQPEHQLRLDLARAVARLRLRVDPTGALELATDVLHRARAAKLADLADESRALMAIAHALLLDEDAARALFEVLSASLHERGAEGTRIHLAQRLRYLAELQFLRGQIEPALILMDGHSRIAARGMNPLEGLAGSSRLPHMLASAGLLEDALVALDRATEELAALRESWPPPLWKVAEERLERARVDLLESLGRTQAPPDVDVLLRFDTLLDALRRDDIEALDRWIRPPGSTPGQDLDKLMMLFDLGVCAPTRHDLDALLDVLAAATSEAEAGLSSVEMSGTPDEQMDTFTFLADTRRDVAAIAPCAAWAGRSDLIRRIIDIADQAGRMSQEGPLSAVERGVLRGLELHATGKYEEASASFEEAADRALATQALSSETGVSLFSQSGEMLGFAVESALMAPKPDLDRVIAYLERMSARDLRTRRSGTASLLAGPSNDEVEEAEAEITRLQRRIRGVVGLQRRAAPSIEQVLRRQQQVLVAELEAIQQRHQQQLRSRGRQSAASYRTLAMGEPPTLAEIQQRLRTDEVLVYYVVRPEKAWAIVVERASARAIRLPALSPKSGLPRLMVELLTYREQLRAHVDGDRGLELHDPGHVDHDPKLFAQVSRSLYQRLFGVLEPIIAPGKRIVIVPGEAIGDLPLAALGDEEPLVARNPVRMVPSAQLLGTEDEPESDGGRRQLRADRRRGLERRPSVLVVGNPDLEADAGTVTHNRSGGAADTPWRELPGTLAEAEAVAELYRTQPLLGASATEAAVVARAQTVDLLHIATHGLADANRPEYSAMVLSTPQSDGTDGILHAFEVERLRLSAKLVVLSACETGAGSIRGSEGVMALDRAFLVAGAGAVVSSLWRVDDEATQYLMTVFHGELKRGQPADVALAEAMRQTRKQPNWRDPKYWAAFRVVGGGVR